MRDLTQGTTPHQHIPSLGPPGLPGMKRVWAGQERRQLSTLPALLQDRWAWAEAWARERHLPVSEEKEDREGLRGQGGGFLRLTGP